MSLEIKVNTVPFFLLSNVPFCPSLAHFHHLRAVLPRAHVKCLHM